jgi:hypothetical protein
MDYALRRRDRILQATLAVYSLHRTTQRAIRTPKIQNNSNHEITLGKPEWMSVPEQSTSRRAWRGIYPILRKRPRANFPKIEDALLIKDYYTRLRYRLYLYPRMGYRLSTIDDALRPLRRHFI